MEWWYELEENASGSMWRGRIYSDNMDSGARLRFTGWHCTPEGAEQEAEDLIEEIESY